MATIIFFSLLSLREVSSASIAQCENGAGGYYDCWDGMEDEDRAMYACQSHYGTCAIGYCGDFSYWYESSGSSCVCSKPEGSFEWIFERGSYAWVGADYGGGYDDITDFSSFVRVKTSQDCSPTSWALAHVLSAEGDSISDGDSHYTTDSTDDGCFDLQIWLELDTWASEVSVSVYEADSDYPIEFWDSFSNYASKYYVVYCLDSYSTWQIIFEDSFGDGWHGGTIVIGVNGDVVYTTSPEGYGGSFTIAPNCDDGFSDEACFDITTAGPRQDDYGDGVVWAWYSYVALFGGICCFLTCCRCMFCKAKPKPPAVVHVPRHPPRMPNAVSLAQVKTPEQREMEVAHKMEADYLQAQQHNMALANAHPVPVPPVIVPQPVVVEAVPPAPATQYYPDQQYYAQPAPTYPLETQAAPAYAPAYDPSFAYTAPAPAYDPHQQQYGAPPQPQYNAQPYTHQYDDPQYPPQYPPSQY